jgi:hypothetical protein
VKSLSKHPGIVKLELDGLLLFKIGFTSLKHLQRTIMRRLAVPLYTDSTCPGVCG